MVNTYVHPKKLSFIAWLTSLLIGLLHIPWWLKTFMKFNGMIYNECRPPKSFFRQYRIENNPVTRKNVWYIEPREKESEVCIMYLHGGAYVTNITSPHWSLIQKILTNTNATLIVPDYPLAPKHSYKEVFKFMDEVYRTVIDKCAGKQIIFQGDSAGGGLSLAFAQYVRDHHLPLPQKMILLSPWLDISMTDPTLKELAKDDILLNISSLRDAAESYVQGDDIKGPLVSPLYGEMRNLPPICLFIGTYDILWVDALRLKDIMKNTEEELFYYEYPKMPHVWMAVPFLPESKTAVEQIIEEINTTSAD